MDAKASPAMTAAGGLPDNGGMAAPKGNRNAVGNPGGPGAPSKYRPQFAAQAEKACQAGFTDQELADLFDVSVRLINRWKVEQVEFSAALKTGKDEADDRVERSLYARAIGYEHDETVVRVIDGQVVTTTVRRRYPPDGGSLHLAQESAPDRMARPTRHCCRKQRPTGDDLRRGRRGLSKPRMVPNFPPTKDYPPGARVYGLIRIKRNDKQPEE